MTKTEFNDLLTRYTNSTRQEADQLLSLEKQYPYSQLLHSLAARLSKDHSLADQQLELQLAAVYAADRHVLKEVMSDTGKPRTGESVSQVTIAIDYADEVIHDLELLHELKHNFEMLFTDAPKKAVTPAVRKELLYIPSSKQTAHKKSHPHKKALTTKKKTQTKGKTASVKKVAKPAKKVTKTKHKISVKLKKGKVLKKKLKNNEDILSEIEATKRKHRLDSPKQREQIELIDQFIKAQPSISHARDRSSVQAPVGDLASFKQGEFGDQIISETLVSILISQGKKEKAVEVLRKLIWKFPQKKAYFAAQIEEFKK